AMIEVAETKGTGWVDYMFPKPGQTDPSQKWTYVKKVTVDGVPGLVASGFYPEQDRVIDVWPSWKEQPAQPSLTGKQWR
ncbi:MAG: cache domain-containing protein, partial [Xanthobacteraceae bacterium]